MYTILVLDLTEAYCADVYTDAEIVKRFSDTSLVPGKIKPGGQSAKRYSQNRQNAITQWFKEINRALLNLNRDNITVCMNDYYYKRFKKYMHTYVKEKVKRKASYNASGLSGVYDVLNQINNGEVIDEKI